MHILITRVEPAATQTAKVLKDLGYQPIVLPLFEVVDTGNAVPVSKFDGYVFTSTNAIRMLKSRNWECPSIGAAAFCVGHKTAEAAKSVGFTEIISADGNAEELANLVLDAAIGRTLKLAYPAGVKRSFDFGAAVAGSSVDIEIVEIYEIQPVFPSDEALERALESCGAGIVFLYSHNTAKHVCNVLFERAGQNLNQRLSVIAISTKTAEAVLKYPWQGVYVADEPTEQSMVTKLHQLSHK